jgi:hypothetical protein
MLPSAPYVVQSRTVRFGWDAAKDEWNRRERGLGFDFAALIFEGTPIE